MESRIHRHSDDRPYRVTLESLLTSYGIAAKALASAMLAHSLALHRPTAWVDAATAKNDRHRELPGTVLPCRFPPPWSCDVPLDRQDEALTLWKLINIEQPGKGAPTIVVDMRGSFLHVRGPNTRLTNTRAPHPPISINHSYTPRPDGRRAAWLSWQVLACSFRCAIVAIHPYLNYFLR